MGTIRKYFTGSIVFTIVSLLIGGFYGYYLGGTVQAVLHTLFILVVLGILETSLSFDNAVVNAKVLKDMDEKWRRRFLTWGILIAVFGMRLVFPIAIVCIAANIGAFDAIKMALNEPTEYEKIIKSSHILIAGFGGSFLLMVGLAYFFDDEKESHWIPGIEKLLSHAGTIKSIEVMVTLSLVLATAFGLLPEHERLTFIVAAIAGVVIHEMIVGLSEAMESFEAKQIANGAMKGGLMSFLYLEVVDASFSFDGVIGAFVLSNNFIIIALGLGIGAMAVRSLTILLVDKGTMSEYKYLEHGAFWSIIVLAGIMFVSTVHEIPELVTGILSVILIGAGFWTSVIANKRESAKQQ